MKTTFRRQFTLIALLLFFSMLLTGAVFRLLLFAYLRNENESTLFHDAVAVCDLAQAYETTGELERNWDFRMSLSFIASVGQAEAIVCDETGTVCICSCQNFHCSHLGKKIGDPLQNQMLKKGSVRTVGELDGIHTDARFISGVPIISEQNGAHIGFVVVSAPTAQIETFLSHSLRLFFIVGLAAMAVGLAAAFFFSKSQTRPLAQVAEAAKRFGHGELQTRVRLSKHSTREINDLAQAFNSMAESLEQSERRREEFVANVSHELKTPMTTIGGFVDGMLDGTIAPEKHPYYLQTVQTEVRRLSRLVRNMLDISRLQSKGINEARKTRFDCADVIGDVLICFEQKITAKHLQISADLPDRAVYVRADKDCITQVLYNLIDNAVKFSPENGPLGISLSQEDGKAAVSVRNTGPTIAPDEIPLLFDRFHKTDKSRSYDRESWGLGLYIAKTIMDAHGGDIGVQSENGVTVFRFTLPSVR